MSPVRFWASAPQVFRPKWRNGRRGSLKNCWGATLVSVRVRPSAPDVALPSCVAVARGTLNPLAQVRILARQPFITASEPCTFSSVKPKGAFISPYYFAILNADAPTASTKSGRLSELASRKESELSSRPKDSLKISTYRMLALPYTTYSNLQSCPLCPHTRLHARCTPQKKSPLPTSAVASSLQFNLITRSIGR